MIANLAALLALAPVVTGVPVALAPTEPAPANVQLSWTSPEHTQFAVTWDETGDARNKVELVSAGDDPEQSGLVQFAEPGQPNRMTFPDYWADNVWTVRVTVVDASGAALSEPVVTPEFDTNGSVLPIITSAVPRVDGSIRFTWKPGTAADPNPNDPLDLPVQAPRYLPVAADRAAAGGNVAVGPAVAGAGSFVLKGRQLPTDVGLRVTPNEWSRRREVVVPVFDPRLTVKIPSSATPGGRLTVTGQSILWNWYCALGPCEDSTTAEAGDPLELQARTGGRWQTVATTKTVKDGYFTFTADFAGPRDYRVIAPPVAWVPNGKAIAYAETPAKAVGGRSGGTGGGLPITGIPVMWIALGGGLLVLLGVVLALTGRRRRRP